MKGGWIDMWLTTPGVGVMDSHKGVVHLSVLSTTRELESKELYGHGPDDSMDWEDDILPIGYHTKKM